MPTLQFKGKNVIWNHHLAVPYHVLEEVPKLHFQADKGPENLIIEGDNLLALKALLPRYQGKVKCVYIDPPYNTGNDGWVYNDSVNSPLIREWLGKEVGKDDLTRHDKWLCMMVPRLKLLRELLADDGAIFISIDDTELPALRQILDEIFGEESFRNTILTRRRVKSLNAQFADEGLFSMNVGFEYVLIYSKSEKFLMRALRATKEEVPEKGRWDVFWSGADRPTMRYELLGFTPKDGQWRYSKEKALEAVKNYETYLKHHSSKVSLEEYWNQTGRKLRFIRRNKDGTGKNGGVQHWVPPHDTTLRTSNWMDIEVSQIRKEFDLPFENPKSVKLIRTLIELIDDKDFVALDSFAGSGTTMHAVMDLNELDGGTRKCILVQMPEATEKEPKKNICKNVTRERIKQAIEKNGYKSGFKYLRVGESIDAESLLSGKLPNWNSFAEYIYYLATGTHLADKSKTSEKTGYIGTNGRDAIYLLYKNDYDALSRMALNLEIAERILGEQKSKKCVVYAPACFLDEDYLREKNIEFVGIPYNLFRRNG